MNEILSKGDRVRVVTGCHKSNDGDKWINEPIWETGTVKGYWVPGITIINLDSGGTKWLKDSEEWEKLPVNRKIATHKEDMVNQPEHYTYGDIEVIDYCDQVCKTYPPELAPYVFNAIKYVSRATHKNGKEDIAKAKYYVQRLFDKWEA
ncbi:DUF3310 domain-containing protein [Staphylococcus schleiferi]|uniref:DUF3310 domain-containing protein n=1 Tax=Staphylococcus schleiferi TaxID=1295 RepID=UPI0021D03E51|nr:DUF3310 domain-containing protein [Staphylococcus schleiferi]UXR54361.1 DUF3310 domain-containing protein [Staphylococcus schleiferi]UXR61266.1 DUF3310 domain-containing protein [Staphylococcus schleiferi]